MSSLWWDGVRRRPADSERDLLAHFLFEARHDQHIGSHANARKRSTYVVAKHRQEDIARPGEIGRIALYRLRQRLVQRLVEACNFLSAGFPGYRIRGLAPVRQDACAQSSKLAYKLHELEPRRLPRLAVGCSGRESASVGDSVNRFDFAER
jgi:hypothetical protein